MKKDIWKILNLQIGKAVEIFPFKSIVELDENEGSFIML